MAEEKAANGEKTAKLQLGALVAIGLAAAAALVGYGQLQGKVSGLERRIEVLEAGYTTKFASIDGKLDTLIVGFADVRARLDASDRHDRKASKE